MHHVVLCGDTLSLVLCGHAGRCGEVIEILFPPGGASTTSIPTVHDPVFTRGSVSGFPHHVAMAVNHVVDDQVFLLSDGEHTASKPERDVPPGRLPERIVSGQHPLLSCPCQILMGNIFDRPTVLTPHNTTTYSNQVFLIISQFAIVYPPPCIEAGITRRLQEM